MDMGGMGGMGGSSAASGPACRSESSFGHFRISDHEDGGISHVSLDFGILELHLDLDPRR